MARPPDAGLRPLGSVCVCVCSVKESLLSRASHLSFKRFTTHASYQSHSFSPVLVLKGQPQSQDVSSTGPSEMGAGIHVQHVFLVTVVRIPGPGSLVNAPPPTPPFGDRIATLLGKPFCRKPKSLVNEYDLHPPSGILANAKNTSNRQQSFGFPSLSPGAKRFPL